MPDATPTDSPEDIAKIETWLADTFQGTDVYRGRPKKIRKDAMALLDFLATAGLLARPIPTVDGKAAIERAARALCELWSGDGDWVIVPESEREIWRRYARHLDRAGYLRTTPARVDEGDWEITVSVPSGFPDGQRDALFTAVADAAHDWEPEERDGWDVDVSAGGPVHRDHAIRTTPVDYPRDKIRDRLHGTKCGCGEWDSHSQEYVDSMDQTINAVLWRPRTTPGGDHDG